MSVHRGWWLAVGVLLAPLLALNLSVAFFGQSFVSPLSPFFVREKLHALHLYFNHRSRCLFVGHAELGPLIVAAEHRHKLPRGLLAAVIATESGNRVHRISFAGAMGPAQLMPATAASLGVAEDPFDPLNAIDASARYLAQQWRHYQSLPLAIAAYNAGPGNVHRTVPHNGETEHYVRRVMGAMKR